MNKFILLFFLLAGCATLPVNQTQSGRPEVTILGVAKTKVMNALNNEMINHKYTIKTSTDYHIVYAKTNTDFASAMLFGSQFNTYPEARVSYDLIENQEGVRVVADCQMVTNPNSAFENSTNFNNTKDAIGVQDFLNRIKISLEAETKKAELWKNIENSQLNKKR